MARVSVNDTTLIAIADAIRTKLGLTTTYKPSEMPEAILAIVGNTEYVPGTGFEELIQNNLDATSLYVPASCADEDGTLYINTNSYVSLSNLRKLEFAEGIVKIVEDNSTNYVPFNGLENCKIIFPSTLKEIYGGFDSYAGKDNTLEFPEGLEVIEDGAFSNLPSSTIILPSTIKRIGVNCFSATSNGESFSIYIKGKPDVIKFDEGAFDNCYIDADGDGGAEESDYAAHQYFFVSWSKSALTIPTAIHRTITYSYEYKEDNI